MPFFYIRGRSWLLLVSVKEFQIIKQYFDGYGPKRRDVLKSIGDDCALVLPTNNQCIAISVDTLVEGVHFLAAMPAKDLGYKSLAVNLSDLAAMGAVPAWMTLALTLPTADEIWIKEFSQGLFEAAEYYNIALVGGDTTRGPKSITITVNGQVDKEKALCRNGAQVGDWIYVTGTLGDSALGLQIIQNKINASILNKNFLINRHYRPTPRVLVGQSISGLASSCIDLSDGLISDITHVMKASNVAVNIDVEQLPLSQELMETVSLEEGLSFALTGGEDYELLFTVSDNNKKALAKALNSTGVKFTCIGQVMGGDGIKLHHNGTPFTPMNLGFTHF